MNQKTRTYKYITISSGLSREGTPQCASMKSLDSSTRRRVNKHATDLGEWIMLSSSWTRARLELLRSSVYETCRSPRVVDHDGALCCHFAVMGRLIMVLPTVDSSARCRVWSVTPLNAVMSELGKVHHGDANPRLFRSLPEFILCFDVIVKLSGC